MGLSLKSSPGVFTGGALEMVSFSFFAGLLLFHMANSLSKGYFWAVVLKFMRARGSNCLDPPFGLKMLIVPDLASPIWLKDGFDFFHLSFVIKIPEI